LKNNGNEKLALVCLGSFTNRGKLVEKYINEKIGSKNEKFVIDINEVRFSNGEAKTQLLEPIRGKDVFIIADVSNHSCTYKMFGNENRMSPDDHFQDIKRAISAMNGRAKRITVVMPLLYASRQHRKRSRESLDCAIALQELVRLGVNNIVSFDIHAPDVQNAIPINVFDNIIPSFAILEHFITQEAANINKEKMLIISPDIGATERAIKYASMLGIDMGLTYKRRDYTVIKNGKNPVVEFAYLGRDVKSKSCVIVDDMIASGGTIIDVARELKSKGAKDVSVITTFALFNDGLESFDKLYKDGVLKSVYSTNLNYLSKDTIERPWFKEVDLTPFIARVIITLNRGESMTKVIDSKERIATLLKKWQKERR